MNKAAAFHRELTGGGRGSRAMRQDDGKIERQTERLTVAVGRLRSLLDAANAVYVKHLYT